MKEMIKEKNIFEVIKESDKKTRPGPWDPPTYPSGRDLMYAQWDKEDREKADREKAQD
tara:strand:- start:65 stop:238 length:174 start_codon:yes stop_codon:yes gene_type:complete